jgi:hypothetical protein
VKIVCAEGHSARAAHTAKQHSLAAGPPESVARHHANAQKIIDCLDLGPTSGAAPLMLKAVRGAINCVLPSAPQGA